MSPSPRGKKNKDSSLPASATHSAEHATGVSKAANKAYCTMASSMDAETHVLDVTQKTLELTETLNKVQNAVSAGKTDEEREAQILKCLPQVKYTALRIAGRLPSNIEVDDLIGNGIRGLLDAWDKFDSSRNVKFETYADLRIRGAILDGLRDQDWVPRALRQKEKGIADAYHALEQQHGRAVTDEEAAVHLGITLDELHKSLDELKGVTLGSFDDADNDSEGMIAFIPDPEAKDPHVLLHEKEIREILKKTIDALPSKERLVVQLYYYDELTMKEIGEILNITESRVSQLHTKTMLRLRRDLRGHHIKGR